jgi:hypothetical protein
MADFYKVLRKTIEALPVATGQARRSVYDRARTAISRQLDAMNPPLPPSEVSRQRLELEDSIRAVEEDYVSGKIITNSERENAARLAQLEEEEAQFRAQRSSRQIQDEAEEMRRNAPPERGPAFDPPPAQQPQTQQPSPRREPAPASREEPSVAAFDAAVASARSLNEPRLDEPRGARPRRDDHGLDDPRMDQPRMEEPVRARSVDPAPAAPRNKREGLSRRRGREDYYDAPALDDPYLDDVGEEGDDYPDEPEFVPERPQPRAERGSRSGRRGSRAKNDGYYDDRQPYPGERRKRRIWPWILILLVLAALAGGGWWAFQNQEKVMTTLENWLDYGSDDVNPLQPAIGESDAGDGPRRVNANDGGTATEPSKNDGRIIDDSGNMNPDVEQGDNSAAVGEGVLPQRAILYEEGATDEDSKAVAGGTSWTLGEDNGSPIIIGRVQIPERRLSLDIIIRKNNDESLASASHLVEISYAAPPRLVGGGIEDIPALLLKNSEEAQGELLASAGVKVSDTLFWLALSAAPENVVNNLKLLREGTWFDLPVRYKNNKRAIVTLEKGREGEVVFAQALESWNRGN